MPVPMVVGVRIGWSPERATPIGAITDTNGESGIAVGSIILRGAEHVIDDAL